MPNEIPYHQNPYVPKYEQGEQRKADKKFYGSATWKKVRAGFIREHPYCVDCKSFKSLEVHHIKDRRANIELQYDWTNLETLCKSCHLRRRSKWFDEVK